MVEGLAVYGAVPERSAALATRQRVMRTRRASTVSRRLSARRRSRAKSAKSRQVIVFTHDKRLPEATRYLGLAATIIEVMRHPASKVAVRSALTPVDGYLSDGHALIRTPEMPEFVKRRVVPGLCRSAIEVACMHCVRVRRLRRGEKHEVVEELLGTKRVCWRLPLSRFLMTKAKWQM